MADQCCCACMRGGENHAAESTAKKKKNKTPQRLRRACGTKQAGGGGERDGAKGQTRDRGWKKNHSNEEQNQQRRVATWGKGKSNGGRGGQEEGPTTGPEENTPRKRKGAGRGWPELGTRTGPGKAANPVGPRQGVAGGPPPKKTGCREKGTGQKRACG